MLFDSVCVARLYVYLPSVPTVHCPCSLWRASEDVSSENLTLETISNSFKPGSNERMRYGDDFWASGRLHKKCKKVPKKCQLTSTNVNELGWR